jgi:hypothetical protein
MTACYVCDAPMQPGAGYAMRVIVPGPGLVEVCSETCAKVPKFSLAPPPAPPRKRRLRLAPNR